MKTVMILVKIFFIGALLIISNGELALSDADSRELFVERYTSWLSELFDKGSIAVGYVISTEWLPDTDYNRI
jgi:preprotein translocase subunit SecG